MMDRQMSQESSGSRSCGSRSWRPSHDAGGTRLARSARAGEQVGMGKPSSDTAFRSVGDGFLSDDLF